MSFSRFFFLSLFRRKSKRKKNVFYSLTVKQVQRVLGHGPAAVQGLRAERPGKSVVEPDVADQPAGGGVEDEAGGAGGVVCFERDFFFSFFVFRFKEFE